jgi:hypothetical protein
MPRSTEPRRARPTHTFVFEIDYHDGRGPQLIKSKAKVVLARRTVVLTLTTADIEESLGLNGAGNTMTCAMSQSCKRQRNQFPHKFVGLTDWLYKTLFVASSVGANGLPNKCVKYEHRDTIGKAFDTPAGQRRLLERIRRAGGSIEVKLLPARDRTGESRGTGRPEGQRTGERSGPRLQGGAARFALAVSGRALSLRQQHAA